MRELIAEEIRALLGRRKVGVSELARRIGVTQPYLSRRLNGDVAIDVDDLARIAHELGVQVGDLLPRASEGRVLPTGGQHRDEKGAGITIRKFGLTNQPGPNGHPKRTQPHPSTRRPGRVAAAYATT